MMVEHAGFIIAAFAASGMGIASLVAWIAWDYRRLRRALDRAGR